MFDNILKFWETEATYVDLIKQIGKNTIVHPYKLWFLREICEQTAMLAGEVAEVGVYKGGSARLIATYLPHKTVHLFDTFEGMPSTDPKKDCHQKGDFTVSFDIVKNYLSDLKNVRIYKGIFPDTSEPIQDKQFALVHVDVDIYTSIKACCEFFYPRMLPGGVIVFDDYAVKSCPGATQAVDEYFADKSEKVIRMVTSGSFVMKLP
jgi:predicted O-methyltransferase YrrM